MPGPFEVRVIQETCCKTGCGIVFWIEEKYQRRLVSTKEEFFCPNGHRQSYVGESDSQAVARLKREASQKDWEIEVLRKDLEKLKAKKRKKRK